MTPHSPKLSLVTGKVERDASFQRLVDSIQQETTVDWELVVSDASETPYPPSERIRVIHEKPRLTHSKGYNVAFRECRGTWIIWLNDDAEVCPDYDLKAIAFMEENPQIGLGCLYYSENGGPFHVNSAWRCVYANFGIFRATVGKELYFFDESIDMYGSDNAFTLRMLISNRGVAGIPSARILHHAENDALRIQNQEQRVRDSRMLRDAYFPMREYWTAAYRRYEIKNAEEVWPHGVRQAVVC